MPAGRPRAIRQLAHCREEGLACRECVGNTARNLTRILDAPTSQAARKMFPLLYPEPECLAMAATFTRLVAEEARRPKPGRRVPYHVAVA
jgi:hypothetical protein